MTKKNTKKGPDPQSKRQKRKAARGATGALSRPNRRAEERLSRSMNHFAETQKDSLTARAFTKPGALKKW